MPAAFVSSFACLPPAGVVHSLLLHYKQWLSRGAACCVAAATGCSATTTIPASSARNVRKAGIARSGFRGSPKLLKQSKALGVMRSVVWDDWADWPPSPSSPSSVTWEDWESWPSWLWSPRSRRNPERKTLGVAANQGITQSRRPKILLRDAGRISQRQLSRR